jgi:hypothetical protein
MHYIQDKPFVIDFAVIKSVCAKMQIDLSQFEKTIVNPDYTIVVVFEGLKRGAKLEGKPFDVTVDQIEELLNGENVYGDFLEAFNEDVLKMFTSSKKKLLMTKVNQ